MKKLLIICLVMLSFAVVTKAQPERDKMVFGGIKDVRITVGVDTDLLNSTEIRSDVESKFKTSAFKVDGNSPHTIFIKILTVRNADKSISYAVILYLDEKVSLQRDSTAKFVGTVTVYDWSGIYTTKSENFSLDVRKKVLDFVDNFLLKHYEANKTP